MPPTDLAIVGAGPTGLFAAFYAGLRNLSVTLLDSLDVPGGQLAALYPEKLIYDAPGFPAVRAKELADRLACQANYYHPRYALGHPVERITHDPVTQTYHLHTAGGSTHARAVLLTVGVGAFRAKKLTLPGAETFEHRGLSYSLSSPDDYRGKHVLIVGAGDRAVDWANTLAPLTASQTLVHRRDSFRATTDAIATLRAGPTRLLTSHELRRIEGGSAPRRAYIYDNTTKQEQSIDTDAILVNLGFDSSLAPIADWGLTLQGGQIVVDHTMMTSRPGIFAAGDVCTYPGKLKLLATAFGEASIAVNHAAKFLDPAANVFPGHSTNLRREQ